MKFVLLFSAAPNIEANFSPVKGMMEGIFVADASIPYLGIGLLSTPVIFTIKDGKVVKVEGGNEAERPKISGRKQMTRMSTTLLKWR